jgi:nuclear transport factor 2 (NTF2) superfamily protein
LVFYFDTAYSNRARTLQDREAQSHRNINTLDRIKQRTNKVYRRIKSLWHMTNNTKTYSIFNWKTVALNKTAENGINGVLIQYY